MAKFDVKIETKTDSNHTIKWDVNKDGKNYFNGEVKYHNLKGNAANVVREAFKHALELVNVPFNVQDQGDNVVVKYNDISFAQFLAIEAACNSVLSLLNAYSVADVK